MRLLEKILQKIPRPFKYIQRKLDIEKQWQQFKANLRPHKYKLTIGLLIILYPIYSSYLYSAIDYGKYKIGRFLQKQTQPTQPTFQWTENLYDIVYLESNICFSIFLWIQKLRIKHWIFCLVQQRMRGFQQIYQHYWFPLSKIKIQKEIKGAIKQIMIQQLKDPEVRVSLNDFLTQLSKNEKVGHAFIQLIQDIFSSKQSQQTIVNLLKKGVTHNEVKQALGESVNFAVREVLSDQQTLNQLKIFIFFLLRKFQNDDEIKGMMDILFAKGLGLVKKKKDPQLDKFLKLKKADLV